MLTRSFKKDPLSMVITTSLYSESQNFGQTFLSERSIRWTLQSAWRYSKSHESWKLEAMTIIGWTPWHTSQLPESSPSRIGRIWMLTRSPKGQWCDYCKARWGIKDPRGQTQAVWQITSKTKSVIVRHYCHFCAMDAQTWPDGSTWRLAEQLDYVKGIQSLDVQFE